MKKITVSLAMAILGLGSVMAPAAYANGNGERYYRVSAYHRGHAPARIVYGYVPGQTTTFYNAYVPGYEYATTGSSITAYNAYAPYPYGRSRWWQRPWPSAPAVWW
jgi:hypothetical protein